MTNTMNDGLLQAARATLGLGLDEVVAEPGNVLRSAVDERRYKYDGPSCAGIGLRMPSRTIRTEHGLMVTY